MKKISLTSIHKKLLVVSLVVVLAVVSFRLLQWQKVIQSSSNGSCWHIGSPLDYDHSFCDLAYKLREQPVGEVRIKHGCYYFISEEPWRTTQIDVYSEVEVDQLVGKKIKVLNSKAQEHGNFNCGQEHSQEESPGNVLTVKINQIEFVE